MEWNMLKESKKLFPHWLDKSDDSNFTKHLKILNRQQLDKRHKLKTVEWSKLLNKPLQIHKTQTEPYKSKFEFEVNVPRLKEVNIYKNPTIVNNEVVNSYKVVDGYFYENKFYKHCNRVYDESEIKFVNSYTSLIKNEEDKYYHDLNSDNYYHYVDNVFKPVEKDEVPQTSLIHSQSFIDNYSHYFRHILYEDNSGSVLINKYVVDEDNNQQYKTVLDYSEDVLNYYVDENGDVCNNEGYLYDEYNELTGELGEPFDDSIYGYEYEPLCDYMKGKYELTFCGEDTPCLYYNVSSGKYGTINKKGDFVEVEDENIIRVNKNKINSITPIKNKYYIFIEYDGDEHTSKIPLIEIKDITPIISNDKYVLEVRTWNDYHFLKGYPEIDFIDYNNNNIIDEDEKTYDNLSIQIETISNKDYLTFRVHQYGIKSIEIFKDDKPIHYADFVIEKLNYNNKNLNDNFAHIPILYDEDGVYNPFIKDTDTVEQINLDVDKYVWRYELSEDDKIYYDTENYELKNKYDIEVTYYDSSHFLNREGSIITDPEYDKKLRKTYVCEDSIFYHDVSLDMIGKLYNVPRYVFRQPPLEDKEEEIEFYSKTYPPFYNYLTEDDYHYQKRLEYYINNYNHIYFPCLELWKYFHIDSELVNRKVIVAEQNYSYMRNREPDEDKYINELSKNKVNSFYTNKNYVREEVEANTKRPKIKKTVSPEDYLNSRNGILIDENGNYITTKNGVPIKISYVYSIIINDLDEEEYIIEYEDASRTFQWYNASHPVIPKNGEIDESIYQIKLTDSLGIVPSTKYRLRFCLKEYPTEELKLKKIYKNRNGDIREVEESVPIRKDYDKIDEYNELVYNDYKKDWGVECEYICVDFETIDTAQNISLYLESESSFKITDVTLQRVTINHYDSEYMKTKTDYNSCVYDLYADYTQIPSNIRYTDLNVFNKILNQSLPLSKIGYFNFILNEKNTNNDMNLTTETNIYFDNMLDVESGILNASDSYQNITEHTYRFNKYVKKGAYEIIIKPYSSTEITVFDMKIDITMWVFDNKNKAIHTEPITIQVSNKFKKTTEENEEYFQIPFINTSDSKMEIKLYRDTPFSFKDFKLIRKAPLTMEEISR